MRIGIVAGEASGDYLGAGLLQALKELRSTVKVEGIAGPRMIQEGAKSVFPMNEISLIGVDGLVRNFSRLIGIRRQLYDYFSSDPPDCFIGIDLPDFNLHLEKKLKACGIPTIHYVSPTIWAWRRWRLKKIKEAVDHMLVLFPFEERLYRESGVEVTFVGHPSADELPRETTEELRDRFSLPKQGEIMALLPGSRINEVLNLGEHFLDSARILHKSRPGIEFVVPYVNSEIREIFRKQKEKVAREIILHEFDGQSVQVMGAADVVLAASGTAALEATMLRKPMVVSYKVSTVSYILAKLLIRTEYISLPNNLINAPLIPEVLQKEVTGCRLSNEIDLILDNPQRSRDMIGQLETVYKQLKNNANHRVAKKILELVGG